ncbi:MAG: NAD(P)/FAD-dependent oxidoreductase [Saccharofermentanales bacterium]
MYDIIIIGKGPAGTTAAIYCARAGRKVLVISSGSGALEKSEKIGNYYGYEKPVTGMELLSAGIRQAKSLGVEFEDSEVTSIDKPEDFIVKTADTKHTCKVLILATGMPRKKPGIRNIVDYEGRGVGYCAVCDAFFYRGKVVGVMGSGDYAYEEAGELLAFTKNITIYTNGREYEGVKVKLEAFDSNIKIDKRKIDHLEGEEKLGKLVFENGEEAALDGLFIAEGTASAIDFAYKLGVENNGKAITAAKDQSTNVPGLFAAGDCTGGILQIGVAVGEGVVAGLSALDYLKKHV